MDRMIRRVRGLYFRCNYLTIETKALTSNTCKGFCFILFYYDTSNITKQPSYHSNTYHCLFTDAITSLVSEEQCDKSNQDNQNRKRVFHYFHNSPVIVPIMYTNVQRRINAKRRI